MECGPDDQVQHDVPIPPFQQLADILRARMRRGDWAPGRKIPSESELKAAYGLSRPTVRKALALLTEEGHIRAVSGLGTYMTDEPPPEGGEGGGNSPEAPTSPDEETRDG